MNNPPKKEKWKNGFFASRIKEILVVGGIAIALLFAVWKVFYVDSTPDTFKNLSPMEEKVRVLLREMEGVGEADVMIYETEEGVQSVVVICEGANNLQVLINVREAVATAVGTQEKNIKIYLKKGE